MESSIAYPERSGEPDCMYYVRHGECGYGDRCRFNHPASKTVLADESGSQRHFPERIGQPDCQYYLRTGDCKYGANCKYNHPCKRDGSSKEEVRLNSTGLPMRLGERECVHYARTGACKFGLDCKFHHPQPANGGSVASLSSTRMYALGTYPSLNPIPLPVIPSTYIMARGSYLPGLQSPTPTSYTPVILSPHWGFKGPISPVTPLDGIEQSSKTYNNITYGKESGDIYPKSGVPPSSVEDGFPERKGQPECQHFLKTGDCKFGAACKFHHPRGSTPVAWPTSCTMSIVGLPLRPGEPQCNFYARFGICKFGPACKFDHPVLLPYYNALGTRPVITVPLSPRNGMLGTSAMNNSSAGRGKVVRDETRLLKEEERGGSVALLVDGISDSTCERIEGVEG